METKLHEIWRSVLLRGLIEGTLVAVYFLPATQSIEALTAFVAAVVFSGSLLELAVAYRLGGHPFRSILIFTGLAGAAIGGFLFIRLIFDLSITQDLLMVMVGLWVALRGFAALWLGLSIVSKTFDRAVPSVAGLLGLIGGAVLLWMEMERSVFVALLALYGAGSFLVHILVALRMWAEQKRRLAGSEYAQQEG